MHGVQNNPISIGKGLSAHQTVMMPGEGADTYQDLCHRLYLELDPATPYQELLVEDIAQLTWEGIRIRMLRDALIVAEFRELATGAFLTGKIEKPWSVGSSLNERKLVDGLFSNDPKEVEKSKGVLAAMGITPEEILARAAQNVLSSTAIYTRQSASVERRRSQIMKEYRELRSAQTRM